MQQQVQNVQNMSSPYGPPGPFMYTPPPPSNDTVIAAASAAARINALLVAKGLGTKVNMHTLISLLFPFITYAAQITILSILS